MPTVQAGDYARIVRKPYYAGLHPTRRLLWILPSFLRIGDIVRIEHVTDDGRMHYRQRDGQLECLHHTEIEPSSPPPARSRPSWGWSLVPAFGSAIVLATFNKEKIMQFDLGSIADSPIVHTSVSHAIAGTAYAFLAGIFLLLLNRVGVIIGRAGDHRRRVAEWKLHDETRRRELSDQTDERRARVRDVEREGYERREEEARQRAALHHAREIVPLIERTIEKTLGARRHDAQAEVAIMRASQHDIRPHAMAPITPELPIPTGDIKAGMWVKCITDSPSGNPQFRVWDGNRWSFRTMQKGDCVQVSGTQSESTFSYRVPPDMQILSAFQKDFTPV